MINNVRFNTENVCYVILILVRPGGKKIKDNKENAKPHVFIKQGQY